jgi:hypothetical protein
VIPSSSTSLSRGFCLAFQTEEQGNKLFFVSVLSHFFLGVGLCLRGSTMATHPTSVDIRANQFYINGKKTYAGVKYNGATVEGLLMNSRMVQGVFDDENPTTRGLWKYPNADWNPDRNTQEFLDSMDAWRQHGLLSFTLNLQGGSPQGYSKEQPWINSAFAPNGSLKPAYLKRLERILDKADRIGMVPMVGLFYFGQEPRLSNESAVLRACDDFTDWLLTKGYKNVVVEIANEVDIPAYRHAIIKPARVHELIRRVQQRSFGKLPTSTKRLLVGTSFSGGTLPTDNVIEASDFVLLHGNGVAKPEGIAELIVKTRESRSYRNQPIIFNEDDHFDFDQPQNNFLVALEGYASWGYFDYRIGSEGFENGYQSMPTNWGISSPRKRGFFNLLKKITRGDRKGYLRSD